MSHTQFGIVIVAHGNIGPALLEVTTQIIPDVRNITAVAIDSDKAADINRALIASAITEVNPGGGTLLLTDMFGGTPSNLCLSFLKPGEIEVVSGVNLPMLIKLASDAQGTSLAAIIGDLPSYGQRHILNASEVLHGQQLAVVGNP